MLASFTMVGIGLFYKKLALNDLIQLAPEVTDYAGRVITVALSGGLGNQLFQYATALALARKIGTTTVGYWRDIDSKTLRKGIQQRTLEITKLFPEFLVPNSKNNQPLVYQVHWPQSLISRRVIKSLDIDQDLRERLRFSLQVTCIERPANFGTYSPEKFSKIRDRGHLIGYWQSPLYFAGLRDFFSAAIRSYSFDLQRDNSVFEEIELEKPIAVHVRRGDYAKSKAASKHHGLLAPEYFETSTAKLMGETGISNVWVFSEDIDYCKTSLRFPPSARVRFVGPSQSNLNSLGQLSLMTRAKAFVISNSSFSWWAAWSSKSTSVVAPHNWKPNPGNSFLDIVPHGWDTYNSSWSS